MAGGKEGWEEVKMRVGWGPLRALEELSVALASHTGFQIKLLEKAAEDGSRAVGPCTYMGDPDGILGC